MESTESNESNESTYSNPEKSVGESIMKRIADGEDVLAVANEAFPGWIVGEYNDYSSDYNFFKVNWEKIRAACKVEKKSVIVVESIVYDNDHTLLLTFCELLTRAGYIVRTSRELIPCKVCSNVLCSEEAWKVLREKGIECPEVWSDKCEGC